MKSVFKICKFAAIFELPNKFIQLQQQLFTITN